MGNFESFYGKKVGSSVGEIKYVEETGTTNANGCIALNIGASAIPVQAYVVGSSGIVSLYRFASGTGFGVRITDVSGNPITSTSLTIRIYCY